MSAPSHIPEVTLGGLIWVNDPITSITPGESQHRLGGVPKNWVRNKVLSLGGLWEFAAKCKRECKEM